MSNTNGDGHFNLIQKTQILAMLSLYEDPEQASEQLNGQGVNVSPQHLARVQRDNPHHIQYIKDSGIADELVGAGARQLHRIKRLDVLTEHLEQELIEAEALAEEPKDWAALLHRYRETMALIMDQDSPQPNREAAAQSPPEDQKQVHRGLSLLELLSNGREPDETFEQLILDATRRVAAASGHTFPPSAPDKFPVE